MRFILRTILIAVLFILFMGSSIRAGGLWLYEAGTPDLGTAGAGRAAMAKDASTAGQNPAGMTRLDNSQILAGAQALFPEVKFDTDESTFGGDNGGNAGYFTPTASLSYVHSMTSDFKLGLAVGT